MDVLVLYSFLTDRTAIEGQVESLPGFIQDHIKQYKDADERALRILSKLLLQKAVGYFYPEEVNCLEKLKTTSHSQLYFSELPLFFSSAHSHKLCLVCASRNSRVGIDAEFIKPLDFKIFRDLLHLNEFQSLKESNDPQKLFYKIWVKKEATLKASGLGVLHELATINTAENPLKIQGEKYFLQAISGFDNYEVQLATDKPHIDFQLQKEVF